jgi:hypothetical protein
MLPPGAIFVLRRPPTPTFFLYKNPGNVEPPNQNCPFETEPEPKEEFDIIIDSIYYFIFFVYTNKNLFKI